MHPRQGRSILLATLAVAVTLLGACEGEAERKAAEEQAEAIAALAADSTALDSLIREFGAFGLGDIQLSNLTIDWQEHLSGKLVVMAGNVRDISGPSKPRIQVTAWQPFLVLTPGSIFRRLSLAEWDGDFSVKDTSLLGKLRSMGSAELMLLVEVDSVTRRGDSPDTILHALDSVPQGGPKRFFGSILAARLIESTVGLRELDMPTSQWFLDSIQANRER